MTAANSVSGATYLACLDQMPAIPAVVFDILKLCRKDGVEVRELAAALNKEPSLTARLLKVANSALFGGRGVVATLDEVILRLGTKSVMLATLSMSVAGVVPAAAKVGDYDLAAFWRRSMVESVAARTFSQRLQRCNEAEAFTCGLLMDLGIPLFAKALPVEYGALIPLMSAGHPDVADEDMAVEGNHAELSGFLLREWRLPDDMADAVAAHHDPDAFEGKSADARDLARILHLAHLVAGVVLSENRAVRLRVLEDKVAAWFGKSGTFVDGVLSSIERGVKEVAETVRISAEGVSPTAMFEQARAELLNLSLAAAAALATAKTKVEELEAKATTDALTGTCNRAFFDAAMTSEWDRRKKAEGPVPLGILMVDVDHFKRFNDTYGHVVGDDVLRTLGKVLRANVRESDLVCRYGGEEFAVICPGTEGPTLAAVAERVRVAVEAARVKTAKGEERITVSIGAGTIVSKPTTSFQALVESADAALYDAKHAGRNRVVSATAL